MNDMLGRQGSGKAIQQLHFHIKKSEIMVNGKCTCCQIVIRRLYPRKYLTEYRHFYNQEKHCTTVQRTSRSAENCTVQIAVGHSNGNLQTIKCIGSAIRISRMQHHALHHHIIRRILNRLSAVYIINSNTTATPSSHKCSPTSKRSAMAGCSGAKT